jgi:hypothetical protein
MPVQLEIAFNALRSPPVATVVKIFFPKREHLYGLLGLILVRLFIHNAPRLAPIFCTNCKLTSLFAVGTVRSRKRVDLF